MDQVAIASEEAFFRFVSAVGSKTSLPKVFEVFPILMQNESWQCRRAAAATVFIICIGYTIRALPLKPYQSNQIFSFTFFFLCGFSTYIR